MKFGQQLRSSLIKEFYYYYISYDELKEALNTDYVSPPSRDNPKPKRKPWTEDDEKSFVTLLEAELDKVYTFQRVKSGEIIRRIKSSEREVNQVIARLEESRSGGNNEASAPPEEEFELLEEDLSEIIADVHDLAKFTQLNYTGFRKIIKKHDKKTSWHLRPIFAARLKAKPFFKDNYDAFIVKLSKLYDIVRTRGSPFQGDSSAGGGQQNFVRQTTKYWVHQDNITELKLIILKHLPVLVFNASKEFDSKDSAISSIYYDNAETWELYAGRLKKTEGAEAIRLRWYGGMENETIFVERKTHREDWTGEKSVKARFAIKEKNVNAFLSGRMTAERVFEKMRKEGKKSDKEINDLQQLAQEIQYRVVTRKLVPVTRSFYSRTAFQLPGDARVRISLDTELTMIREDNLDGKERSGKNWRRMDIGIDYPFNQLADDDLERFPYAVLEVKLQTQAGQEAPTWVRDLVSSHLVEAVPKFSKFIHGTATLNPTRIHLLPYWMPQMDVDIRKPVTHNFGIERPGQAASYSTSEDPLDIDDDDDDDDEDDEAEQSPSSSQTLQGEHREDAGVDGDGQSRNYHDRSGEDRHEPNEMDEEERVAHLGLTDPDDYPIYDSEEEEDEEDALEEARRVGGWPYFRALAKHYTIRAEGSFTWFAKKLVPAPRPTAMPQPTSAMSALPAQPKAIRFKAPKGKRIHVPVRVEPKVFFAAERTFLSWLEFSIYLGAVAGVLLNFGDSISLYASWGFTVVAVLALLYSLGVYLWRVEMIRNRRAVKYHDWLGPSVLCGLLLLAVVANFGMRIKADGWFV